MSILLLLCYPVLKILPLNAYRAKVPSIVVNGIISFRICRHVNSHFSFWGTTIFISNSTGVVHIEANEGVLYCIKHFSSSCHRMSPQWRRIYLLPLLDPWPRIFWASPISPTWNPMTVLELFSSLLSNCLSGGIMYWWFCSFENFVKERFYLPTVCFRVLSTSRKPSFLQTMKKIIIIKVKLSVIPSPSPKRRYW